MIFLISCARGGKSTWANKWVKDHSEKPRVIIAGDDFRRALHGDVYKKESEGFVFAAMDVAARALIIRGHSVCIDETATTPATIKRYLKIDINAQPVVIDTPLETCIERAIITDQKYLIPVIKRHRRQLDELLVDFDNKMKLWRKEVLEGYWGG